MLAATITRSHWMPDVTNVFEPLSRQCSPSHFALAAIARRSEPVPGSVIAIAGTLSPVVTAGSQRARCSAVVRSVRYGTTMSLTIAKLSVTAPV